MYFPEKNYWLTVAIASLGITACAEGPYYGEVFPVDDPGTLNNPFKVSIPTGPDDCPTGDPNIDFGVACDANHLKLCAYTK